MNCMPQEFSDSRNNLGSYIAIINQGNMGDLNAIVILNTQ